MRVRKFFASSLSTQFDNIITKALGARVLQRFPNKYLRSRNRWETMRAGILGHCILSPCDNKSHVYCAKYTQPAAPAARLRRHPQSYNNFLTSAFPNRPCGSSLPIGFMQTGERIANELDQKRRWSCGPSDARFCIGSAIVS